MNHTGKKLDFTQPGSQRDLTSGTDLENFAQPCPGVCMQDNTAKWRTSSIKTHPFPFSALHTDYTFSFVLVCC